MLIRKLDDYPVLKYLLIAVLVAAALAIRFALIDHRNIDIDLVIEWYNHIAFQGGFWALKDNFSNYNVPYLYLLGLATLTRGLIARMVFIKSISIFFDLLSAFAMFRLVQLRYPSKMIPWLAFFAVLFVPTVILNSSYWGQCDSIYTSFLLLCVYFLCKGKPNAAMAAFALSFSFKFQAVFFGPFILILFLKKVIPWRSALIFPAVYLGLLVPAWIAGRPILDLLGIYLEQTNTYAQITLNAPNFYVVKASITHEIHQPLLNNLALLISFLAAAVLVTIPLLGKAKITPRLIVLTATISVVAMPFFLPHMHERYFYPADLLSIALAFYFPAVLPLPLIFQYTSLASYMEFLNLWHFLELYKAARINLVSLGGLFLSYIGGWLPLQDFRFLTRIKKLPLFQKQEM